jgi:hypothetical protein
MRIAGTLTIAAAVMVVGCSDGTDPGVFDAAKGKPDLTDQQVCESFRDDGFYAGLMALCAATADEETEFLSRNNGSRDRWGLIGKLNRAGQKCADDGDVSGTLSKLADFKAQVLNLRSSGKIGEPDGVDLAGDAQTLIDGFDPTLTNPPVTCPEG